MSINSLRTTIEFELGHRTPDVDPAGPREEARIVILLESPGVNAAAASGVCSPWVNLQPDDRASMNLRRLLPMAGLDREVSERLCVWWNAIAWPLTCADGKDRRSTADEQEIAAPYLATFVHIVQPDAVVAMGRPAQRVCSLAGVDHLAARHPARFNHATVQRDIVEPLAEALRRARGAARREPRPAISARLA